MNKSYISVWNDASGTWVAAPETARTYSGSRASSARTILSGSDAMGRPASPFRLALMPIAMAIGAVMMPGTAAAQATTGNGGLELCPAGVGGMGSSWGPLSSSIGMMDCSSAPGVSFSLNNGAADNGSYGYADGAITARVTGFDSGLLQLQAAAGISMLNAIDMNGNKIGSLADGNVAAGSADAVNGGQLYRYTRYFNANSTSSDPSTDAQARGANSVASGPSSKAIGANSSAYGANAVALVSNSVALGAGSVASRNDSVSVGYLSSDGKSQYTRQITNVTAGAAGTDAVNVDQLNAAIASVNGGGGVVPDNVVTYDNSTSAQITLKGAKGTKITNLTAGDVSSPWSTDAVNGSQLYSTNQNVANVANSVTIVSNNLANVTNVTNVVNNIVNNGIAGNPLVVTYDSSARNSVTLGGVGGGSPVKLTNVAAGDISSLASTDAVNGGQLFKTNQNLQDLANNVGQIGTFIFNNGVKYFHANSTLADSSAAGTESVAIGGAARSIGDGSISIGSGSQANTNSSRGAGNIAIGQNALASTDGEGGGNGVTALGANAKAGSSGYTGATAIGAYAQADYNATALGVNALASSGVATALGNGATASASNSVALGAKSLADRANTVSVGSTSTQRQIVNVAAGTQDADAVNLGQMNTAIANASLSGGGSSPDAVIYDSSLHDKLTLGGASASMPVGLTNVAAGQVVASSTDAVNGGQLHSAASGLASAFGAGASVNSDGTIVAPSYQISGTTYNNIGDALDALNSAAGDLVGAAKYVKVVSTAQAALASGAESVAIGGAAMATGARSLAIGSGASSAFLNSVAIGVNAVADAPSTVSFGSRGDEKRLTHVANGIADNDAATIAQLNALQSQLVQSTPQSGGVKSMLLGAVVPVTSYIAVSPNVTAGASTSASTDMNAMAIGPVAAATAVNALSIGAGSSAGGGYSTSVGSGAGSASVNSTAIGAGATVGALSDNSVVIGYNSRASAANALAMGGNASATSTGSVAIGYNAFINQSATNGMALGLNASVSAANGVAIGYNSVADRANAVSVGSASKQSQITYVAAGTANTDAVNVRQLSGVVSALGGGATIDSSGNVKAPTYTVGGQSYSDVGSAITAAVAGGSANSVQYDNTSHSKVTLGGAGVSSPVTLSNVANGVANSDAVNLSQLKAIGANIDSNGVVTTSFVAYDDTSKSKVTFGGSGSTRAVTLSNVANGVANSDAVNLSQLKAIGANIDSSGVVTTSFVAYDDTSKSKITFGGSGSTRAVTLTNVANGVAKSDAVNVAQLQAMGATIGTSGVVTNSFVAYDDSTLGSITLKGDSGTKITKLADGTLSKTSTDAVTGAQLFATNANVANVAGNMANLTNTVNNIVVDGGGIKYFHVNSTLDDSSATGTNAVAIGGAASASASNSVALGSNSVASRANAVSIGSSGKERQLINVANGTSDTDAVNLSQLKAIGANIDSSGVVTNSFVAYDDTSKSKITFGGSSSTRAVTLTNVANGVAKSDAVNVAQLQAMGATIGTSGVVTNSFVAYDDTSKGKITFGGVGSTTPVALTNVAAGKVAASSSDAVNGAQLYGTAASIATALGGGGTVQPNGTLSAPSFDISGTTYHDVGSALDAVDGQLDQINTNYSTNLKYVKIVSSAGSAQASGTESIAIGGNAMATGDHALAIGAGSSAAFLNSTAIGVNATTDAPNTVSVGSRGMEMRITHVANGINPSDAATVAQLGALQTQLLQNTSQVNGVKSMLLGASAPVTDYIKVSSNVTPGGTTTASSDLNAMAIGPVASATGIGALTVGAGSIAGSNGSTSVGSYATAGSINSTSIGAGASVAIESDNAVAIGYMARSSSTNALALGSNASATAAGSIAIGYNAFVSPAATNSMSFGLNSSVSAANSVAIGYNAVADRANVVSVGSSKQTSQIINVAAGTQNTDAVNLGQMSAAIAAVAGGGSPNAVVYDTSAHTSVTLGSPGTPVRIANVADGAANNDAVNVAQLKAMGATIGSSGTVTNAFVAYDDTTKGKITLGGVGATAPVALTNVAAGQITSTSKDAINGAQLYNTASSTAAALGGGSTVGSDGKVSKPTYTLNGTTYNDVGAALVAAAASGGGGSSPDAVNYDTSLHNKVTLGNAGKPVTLSNVADGVANNDAVNVEQLKAMGASINSNGTVSNAFVAYDDTTKGKITFGGLGATTPVLLTNVASGQITSSSRDAVNGSQLYNMASSTAAALGGGASVNSNGQILKPTYTLSGNTFNDVGAALAAVDAKATTGSVNGVVYDTSAHDTLTLGNVGVPVTIANVAAATSDDQAVNLKQLKEAGLNVDTAGNVTNSFVSYDDSTRGTVTFNSGGSPTQLKNIAAGTDLTDAVNFGQMQSYVAQNGGGNGGTANGVAYDDSTRSQVTLGGVGATAPVTLTNLAAGANATDAVNFSQFSSLQSQVNNLSNGGAGDSTYVNINTSSGGTAAVASGSDAIAIGNGAAATGAASIAIGKNTVTAGDNSVAMGMGATAPNANAVALGANSTTDRDNSVSVGSAGSTRQITNVAAGTQATDAVNLGQLNNALGNMSSSINNVDRNAAKGIASSAALNIVTPYLPGRTTINAGVSNYRGFQAVGLGVSRWNEKGTINYNLGVSSSGGNSTIVRAGIGIVLGN